MFNRALKCFAPVSTDFAITESEFKRLGNIDQMVLGSCMIRAWKKGLSAGFFVGSTGDYTVLYLLEERGFVLNRK